MRHALRRSPLVLAAVSFAALLPAAPAHAAGTPNYVATAANTFLPGDVGVNQGEGLTLLTLDNGVHDVTSFDTGPDGPLFRSDTIAKAGSTAKVRGVESLPPGAYSFYCSVHMGMHGSLNVA